MSELFVPPDVELVLNHISFISKSQNPYLPVLGVSGPDRISSRDRELVV